MSQKLAAGDTADPISIGAQINGVLQDMSDAGWICQVVLMGANRNPITPPRNITELVTSGTVQKFRVVMLISEADMMGVASGVQKFFWTIQVTNLSLNYRRETDIELIVRSNAIA